MRDAGLVYLLTGTTSSTGRPLQYASQTSTSDANSLIDERKASHGYFNFVFLASGNLYYRDAGIKTATLPFIEWELG
jgi:hypothetical protein